MPNMRTLHKASFPLLQRYKLSQNAHLLRVNCAFSTIYALP
jgi:hypothetical protein